MAEEKLASRWLVSTDWLSQHLTDPTVIVLDASYYLANHKRDAQAEFLAGHIPGAQRFDIDAVSDKSNPLPHMLMIICSKMPRMRVCSVAPLVPFVVFFFSWFEDAAG